jgi:hypothetical protein
MVIRVQTRTKIKITITLRVVNLMHLMVLMPVPAAGVEMVMHIVPITQVIIIAVIGTTHLYQMNQDSKADQMVA